MHESGLLFGLLEWVPGPGFDHGVALGNDEEAGVRFAFGELGHFEVLDAVTPVGAA